MMALSLSMPVALIPLAVLTRLALSATVEFAGRLNCGLLGLAAAAARARREMHHG